MQIHGTRDPFISKVINKIVSSNKIVVHTEKERLNYMPTVRAEDREC